MSYRPLIRRIDIGRSWEIARRQYAALEAELAVIKRERNELRACLCELQAAVQERWAAQHRLAELYRERAIARAQSVEHDPAALLH